MGKTSPRSHTIQLWTSTAASVQQEPKSTARGSQVCLGEGAAGRNLNFKLRGCEPGLHSPASVSHIFHIVLLISQGFSGSETVRIQVAYRGLGDRSYLHYPRSDTRKLQPHKAKLTRNRTSKYPSTVLRATLLELLPPPSQCSPPLHCRI